MVTLADESNSKGTSSVLGDLLVLLSAVFYASYTIAIRRCAGECLVVL
jgi:drug/metabolite transporter (DMT)-like permease